MNLMDDKETILISRESSIEKLTIEKNKLKLENFLSSDVHIHYPGFIINYKNEYAWTNGANIGFINNKYYNIINSAEEIIFGGYSGGYKANIVKLFQYKDDILFIFYFCGFDHHMDNYSSIKMGSYFRETNFNNFMNLERFGAKVDPETDYKIYCLKNDELIICALKNIYIVDYINWRKKAKIPFTNRIIKNSYYLNDNYFLLFFEDFDERDYDDYDYNFELAEMTKPEKQNNIGIMKIVENGGKFIYENLFNKFDGKTLYYNFNGSCEQFGLNQNIIALNNSRMEFYRFININKSFKIDNNKK